MRIKKGTVYTVALSLFVFMPKTPPSPPDAMIDKSLKILLTETNTIPFTKRDIKRSTTKYTPPSAMPFKRPRLSMFFAKISAPKNTDRQETPNIIPDTVLSEMFEKYTITAKTHTSAKLIKMDKKVPVTIFFMLIKKPPKHAIIMHIRKVSFLLLIIQLQRL